MKCDHQFEPRYTEVDKPDIEGVSQIMDKILKTNFMDDNQEIRKHFHEYRVHKKIYVGDFCMKCGELIRLDDRD